MMNKLGVEVSKKELEHRMLEFDHDKDGTIDFPEFLCIKKDVLSDVHEEERLQEIIVKFFIYCFNFC